MERNNHRASPVQLELGLSLLSGLCLIVGTVIGTGIFLSPTAVLLHSGSVGLSLLVWLLGGVQALLGALCFAELGLFFDVLVTYYVRELDHTFYKY